MYNQILYAAMQRAVIRAMRRIEWDRDCSDVNLLDIGIGTGFWLDFWNARGVRKIVGIDLVRAAVDAAEARYPNYEFHARDISEPRLTLGETFDVISAMSVLLHITDDGRFDSAIHNIAQHLRPGGVLLVMDPVLTQRRRPRLHPGENSRVRHLDEWSSALVKNGCEVIDLIPVTCFLGNPVEGKTEWGFRALLAYWRTLYRILVRWERFAKPIGTAMTVLDRAALALSSHGPGTKVLVARRVVG